MSKIEFEAVIEKPPGSNASFIVIPFDVQETFGTKGRVKIKATFDGHPYRGSLAPMAGQHILGLRKDIRAAIGKDHGETVLVVIEPDTEPRTVPLPDELETALDENPKARDFFNSLSYTNQKEYARWVESAKKAETKDRRLAKTIENLLAGVKRP
jgi:hypothetical protein